MSKLFFLFDQYIFRENLLMTFFFFFGYREHQINFRNSNWIELRVVFCCLVFSSSRYVYFFLLNASSLWLSSCRNLRTAFRDSYKPEGICMVDPLADRSNFTKFRAASEVAVSGRTQKCLKVCIDRTGTSTF